MIKLWNFTVWILEVTANTCISSAES